mgnify:CR=1 FL=1
MQTLTNIIPKVVDYINSYNGEFDNTVYTDELISVVVCDNKNDFQKIYDEGIKCYKDQNNDEALKLFKWQDALKKRLKLCNF